MGQTARDPDARLRTHRECHDEPPLAANPRQRKNSGTLTASALVPSMRQVRIELDSKRNIRTRSRQRRKRALRTKQPQHPALVTSASLIQIPRLSTWTAYSQGMPSSQPRTTGQYGNRFLSSLSGRSSHRQDNEAARNRKSRDYQEVPNSRHMWNRPVNVKMSFDDPKRRKHEVMDQVNAVADCADVHKRSKP